MTWDSWRRALWGSALALAAAALLAFQADQIVAPVCAGVAILAAMAALYAGSRVREQIREAPPMVGGLLGTLPSLAQNVLEPLPDPMMILDSGGRALFANRAMRAVIGTDVERKPVSALFRTPALLEAIAKASQTGVPTSSLEFAFGVPVERSYEAFVARTGTAPSLIVITLRDRTTAKRTEQMRSEFVANASHELRTPLAAVSGFIDTLRGHARDDPEARERFLGIMSVEAGRMRRLIDDLLSLNRIELNEHVPPSAEIRLEETVRDAAAALSPLAESDGMSIEIGNASGLPPVRGERDELIQLFQNLIHNAIKYGREGGTVRVSFGVTPVHGGRRAESLVFAAVHDNGEGIPQDAIPRLTERFYRVDVKRSRERGGTGLGLAIVKHILNHHDGKLQIESRAGEGSTFTVSLPAAVQAAPAPVTEVL